MDKFPIGSLGSLICSLVQASTHEAIIKRRKPDHVDPAWSTACVAEWQRFWRIPDKVLMLDVNIKTGELLDGRSMGPDEREAATRRHMLDLIDRYPGPEK